MKASFRVVLIGLVFTIVSCKKDNSLPDPPTDIKYEGVTSIDGPLSGYMEVVPGTYQLDIQKEEGDLITGYNGSIKVKFRFLKPIDVKTGQGYNAYGPNLIGKVLDSQGVPLDFTFSLRSMDDLGSYLKRGTGEEWLTFTLSGQGLTETTEDAFKQLEVYMKGAKIRFNSEIIEEHFESGSSSSKTESSTSDKSGETSNVDCDEFLKGYEQFMEDYIAMLEKYKNNPDDSRVMAEYTSMMTEATKWASKSKGCENDPTFMAKFTEIQLRITKANSY